MQPQIRRLKSSGPVPGDSGLRGRPDGLPSRTSARPARDFSADAPQDAVILSVRDLAVAKEAVRLDRLDQEGERRTSGGGDGPAGTGSAGRGTPGQGTPPATPQAPPPPAAPPPAAPPPGSPPGERPDPAASGPGVPTAAGKTPGSAGPAAPRGASSPPSWGTVLLTTVRLWVQRHWPAQARWRVLTVLILATVLFGAGAITIALTRSPAVSGPTGGTQAGKSGTQAGHGGTPTPAAIRAAAAARTAAAAWIAGQVSADAIVACDPQTCGVLAAHGVPAARLLPLGGSNPAPLGSDVIVSTAAVRSEFGARLASVYAPVVLASFGTGSAQTAVRVVASDGGLAYLRGLRADVAARASAGRQLLQNPGLRTSAAARRALAAGQVDSRLLTVFAALATMYRVQVVGFAAPVPGASAGMPLRAADIAPAAPGTRRRPDTMAALASYLRNQLTPYQPGHITVVRLASGQPVLRVEYGAPSPLGLLGKG